MNIEFIQPSKPSKKAWMTLFFVIFFAFVMWMFFAWEIHVHRKLMDQLSYAKMQIDDIKRRDSQVKFAEPLYAPEARKIWEIGAFPTQVALGILEKTTVPGVSLSNIDINANKGLVRIEFEVPDFDSLDQYLKILNSDENFPKWTLKSIVNNSTITVVSMHVLATWCVLGGESKCAE